MVERSGEKIVETAREARAGYLDRPVLLVLVIGTVLAAGFMLMVWKGGLF